jgi:DNA-binding transcriptional MerR regulator
LERVEQQIGGRERRGELTAAIAEVEREIRLLETATRRPSVLREASDLLRRLTAGELDEITITKERAILICNRRGNEIVYHQLGSRSRDQIYLSLCLAVVAAHAREGVRLPIVLQDRLLHVDSEDLETTASLLSDFAGRGHQIFVFTQHKYVADLFRSLGVPVRKLPRPITTEAIPVDLDKEKELTDAQRSEVNRQLNAIAEETAGCRSRVDYPAWNAEEFPGELTDRVQVSQPAEPEPASKEEDDGSKSRFFLQESSPIREAPSIDSAIAECLRKIGVLRVRDLLHLNVEEAADRLRHAGITAVMIRRWQAEALLTCRIAGLRPFDARILVACGITDPNQLIRTDVDELRRRVELFGATETGQRLFQSGTRSELLRVTDWIRAAKNDTDSDTVLSRELRAA